MTKWDAGRLRASFFLPGTGCVGPGHRRVHPLIVFLRPGGVKEVSAELHHVAGSTRAEFCSTADRPGPARRPDRRWDPFHASVACPQVGGYRLRYIPAHRHRQHWPNHSANYSGSHSASHSASDSEGHLPSHRASGLPSHSVSHSATHSASNSVCHLLSKSVSHRANHSVGHSVSDWVSDWGSHWGSDSGIDWGTDLRSADANCAACWLSS